MDRPDVFMPLYIGDYLAGTSRLTTEHHGAYMLLIMDYWMNGQLPDSDQALASITKLSFDAWSIARAVLMHYFKIENGKWIHKRIEEELTKATEKKQKARDKAQKGAFARWNNATSIPQAMLRQCPSPSPSPSVLKDKDNVISNEIPSVPYQEIVELFNKTFPELPQVRSISEERKKILKQRWFQNDELQSIEQIGKFFHYIRKSDFLMSRTSNPFNGLCFDWIFNKANFTKIYEGNYHK